MKTDVKSYGFVKPRIIGSDQWQGGRMSGLPKVELRPSGDWSPYYPHFERQVLQGGQETCGCTIWGTISQLQMLEKFLTGETKDYSERYVYNICQVNCPGQDPHNAYEAIRKYGLIEEKELPDTNTLESFNDPRPMTAKYYKKGRKWPWRLNHEWYWVGGLPKDKRTEFIRQGLKRAPIAVSVVGWIQDANGLYISDGRPNTHWCVIGREIPGKGWEAWDSYEKRIKILSYDHDLTYAKLAMLTPKSLETSEGSSWLGAIGTLLKNLTDSLKKLISGPDNSQKALKLLITRIAIEEGVDPDLALAVAECESSFKPRAVNANKDKTIDRGIYQWNSFWHPDITNDMAFDPETACRLFCKAVKDGNLYWWNASKTCWSRKLNS